MTTELIEACKHVVSVFPEVDHLFVSLDGRWLFCESIEPVNFNNKIQISLLEDMVDSLNELPMAVYIPDVLK